MTRGGSKSDKSPTRRCIATRKDLPKESLIRFALDPNQQVTPDINCKLPGRGLWVAANGAALKTAIDKNLFARAAKTSAIVPEGLFDLVDQLLAKQVITLISLARKSGYMQQGYETVKTLLITEKVRLLLQAYDGSAKQIARLRPPHADRHITALSQEELGLAFGRDYVIHAALTGGGLISKIQDEAGRLSGLRFPRES